jgi:hypothetical protein
MSNIDLTLYQVTPSENLLIKPATAAITALLDSKLIENTDTVESLEKAVDVRDLLNCFNTGEKNSNRLMSLALHHVLSTVDLSIPWDSSQKGIRISQFEELITGDFRIFQSARFARLSADQRVNEKIYFNVEVRNRGVFSEDLPVVEIMEELLQITGSKPVYLPAFDTVHNNHCVITGFALKPIYHRLEGRQESWGEFLVRHGRLSQIEFDRRMASYSSGNKAETEILIAWCRHGHSSKMYGYPAKDLVLVASTALQGYVDDRRNKDLPLVLEEAGNICAAGFKAIRSGMDDKAVVFEGLEKTLAEWFVSAPHRPAQIFELDVEQSRDVRRREKYSLKAITSDKNDLLELNSHNALLYPIDGTSEKSKKVFLGFFNGGQAARLGFKFNVLDYHQQVAIEQPWTIADRVEESVGPAGNVVMAWRRRSNGLLVNNKLVEFELMQRGIAVQHVIDEGQRGNANKVGNLLQGMTEKFALRPQRKIEVESPFDFTLGLDVSRYGGQDIPAFPVVVDKDGGSKLYMAETFERGIKERRTVGELIQTIESITNGGYSKVLFIRDGYAYEDFEAVATALPQIELTVLSIRKNLLSAFSDRMPTGKLYALYSDHDSNRFLFGVNARQGESTRINSVHMVEIVRNPGKYGKELLANVLIELSRQNRTSEFEIASLPFPIAYADRSAWVVRDMMQDRQLRKYVRNTYAEEVNNWGDEGLYIYSVIRNFVLTRPNGYAFAI